MPSKNMIKKGKRRQTVKHDYRIARDAARAAGLDPTIEIDQEAAPEPEPEVVAVPVADRVVPVLDDDDLEVEEGVRTFAADAAAQEMRLDAYLAKALPDISRSRVQTMAAAGQIKVDGEVAKSSLKLKAGQAISIEGEPRPEPLKAFAEDIPLDIVFEDKDMAVINKPAGMMVHAGAGASDDARNHGTLVNALLGHFGKLSEVGGALRPGIVHRLDKMTSGLIMVAKNDSMHRKLADLFQERSLDKVYVALVQGLMPRDSGTVSALIERDLNKRTRMTTKRQDGRPSISHWSVLGRFDGPAGKFTLVEVKIETGRTHQIRVHMASLGFPVVGDTLYGAAATLKDGRALDRNFLHAARLTFIHPRTKKKLDLKAPLPEELSQLLKTL